MNTGFRKKLWAGLGALALACGGDSLNDVPPTGAIEGYVCDPLGDFLAANVIVRGRGPNGSVQTTTDVFGYFVLKGLEAGPQNLAVVGATFSDALSVDVAAEKTTRLPDPSCLGTAAGSLRGKICGIGGGIGTTSYWVEGARVFIVEGSEIYEDTTDGRGDYELVGVPPGPHTLHVEKGSYEASSEVNVISGEANDLDPVCVGADVKVGIVTGLYDNIDKMLVDLGLRVGACIPSDMSGCPSTTANGGLTLIDGLSSDYITEVLMDPVELGKFDILFFTCGLADVYLGSSPPEVFDNLRDFVSEGGSVYVSDWAYELLRLTFPASFDFYGDDGQRGAAKVGLIDNSLLAYVVSAPLIDAVGSTRVPLTYVKGSWVVPSPSQPVSVEVWIKGDVSANVSGSATTIANAPLLMHVTYGEGDIVYTTFHATDEADLSVEMQSVLDYIVFEL
jgi:hypothetical protein